MKRPLRNFLLYWLPPLLWAVLVLLASTDLFGARNSAHVLRYILMALFGPIEPSVLEFLNFLARKSAHVTEYAILSWLFFRAWRQDNPVRWRVDWARHAIAICIAVAAVDEYHQGLTYARTSSGKDVLLDTAGALVALLMVWLFGNLQGRVASQ